MKKRMIAIISVLLLTVTLCSPLFVFAFEKTDEREASLLQEGDFDIEYSEKFSSRGPIIDYFTRTVQETIYEGLLNVSSSISISRYSISVNDIDALYSDVVNDNPDLFYVSSTYQIFYSGNQVNSIKPFYSMSKAEINNAKEIFDSGASKALNILDSSMNDIQKVMRIHDYICTNAIYPVLGENKQYYNEIYHSAYGFFYDGNAVCAGYTLTFSYLMHELGFECEYVSSSSMHHAWNKILLDGNWYNIDITYDNHDYIEGKNTVGSVRHDFFLKSDNYFASESGMYHFDGKTYDTCNANSTAYDSAFWDDVYSEIFVIDGNYYYLKSSFTNRSSYLVKRTASGSENRIGKYHYSATVDFENGIYDSSGVLQTITSTDILIKLTYLDGRFYIADQNAIYSQLLNGTEYKIKTIEYYPVGLSVEDNNIVYNIFNDENIYKIDKLEFFSENITTSKGEYNNYPDINNDGFVNAKDYAMIIKN